MSRSKKSSAKNLTGGRIEQARRACRPAVSQMQLARMLARRKITLGQTAISRIEKRQRGVLDLELAAIAKCLQVSIASLFGE